MTGGPRDGGDGGDGKDAGRVPAGGDGTPPDGGDAKDAGRVPAGGDGTPANGAGPDSGQAAHAKAPAAVKRRRRWRRWLLAVGCLVLLLLGGVVLFRNSLVRTLAPRLLGPALGLEIEIDEVSLSLGGDLEVRGLRSKDPQEWTQIRELRFDEARVVLSLIDLALKGVEGIRSISLAGAVLDLDLDRPGSADEPDPSPPTRRRDDFRWPQRLPAIEVSFHKLSLARGEDFARFDALRLESGDEEERSRVTLRSDVGWRVAERSDRGPLGISFDYRSGVVSGLSISAGERQLVQEGDFDLARLEGRLKLGLGRGGGTVSVSGLLSGRAEAEIQLGDLPLGELTRLVSGEESSTQGDLSIRVKLMLPLDRPLNGVASLGLALAGAEYRSMSLPRVELEARVDDRVVRVGKLRAAGEHLDLRCEGLRLSLESLDPQDLLRSVSGVLLLECRDLSKVVSSLVDDARLRRLTAGASISGRIRVDGTACAVETLELVSPRYAIALDEGRSVLKLDAPAESPVDIRGTFRVDDLSMFAPLLPEDLALRGKLEGSFSARGSLAEPSADAGLLGESLEVAGVSLGALEAQVSGNRSSVEIRRLSLSAGAPAPLRLVASGRMEVAGAMLQDVSLSLEGSDLSSRAAALGEAASWLPRGPFRLSVGAQGPAAWPDLELSLKAEGLKGSSAGSSIDARLSKKSDDVVLALEARGVSEPEGRASIELSGRIERAFASGELSLQKLAAVHQGSRWENSGEARIRFRLDRRSVFINPPLVLQSGKGRILVALAAETDARGDDVLTARLEAEVPGGASLPTASGAWRTSGVKCDVFARYGGHSLPSAGGMIPRSLEFRLLADEAEAPEGLMSGRTGPLRVTFQFREADPRPEARLSVDVSRVRVNSLAGRPPLREPLAGDLSVRANWDGERIRLETLTGELAGVSLSGEGGARFAPDLQAVLAGGKLSPPEGLDVSVRADFADLSVVRQFAPGLRRTGGRLKVESRLEGALPDPRLSATLVLEKAEARFGDVPTITALESRMFLENGSVRIESLEGEIGGSPIEMSGSIENVFRTPRLNVVISGDNLLLVRSDKARLRADTSLSIAGELAALRIDGKVRITDGRVIQEVPLFNFLASLSRQVGGLATRSPASRSGAVAAQRSSTLSLFSLREPPLKDLRLNVTVEAAEAIELRGNVFRGKVRPEVTLLGSGEVPYLSGVVYLSDFILSLPATRIRIESGSVRFGKDKPMSPELQLSGTTRMRGHDITVTVTGPVNEPSVVFSSSPPLPTDQLVLLVTTGKAPESTGPESEKQAILTVAKYFGVDLLRKLFGEGDVDSAESILDRFDFDVGRNVSRSGRESYEASFRLTRNLVSQKDTLFLVGDRDEFDHYNIGLRIVFRGR